MMGLFRTLVLAAALLALLTTSACGNDESESSPSPQSTAVSPAAQSSVSPTNTGQEPGASPAPQLTATAGTTPESPSGGAIEMGVDVDTTGNTASTLGTVESCVRVDIPNPSFDGVSDHSIDVYVKGDTQPPTGYDAWLTYSAVNDGCPAVGEAETGDDCLNGFDDDDDGKYNDGCPQVGATGESGTQCDDHEDSDGDAIVHVAAPDTDTLIKMPDAIDLGNESLPDSDGTFLAGVIDVQGNGGIAGDGVLMRVGLDIGGSGVVTLVLNPPPLISYLSTEAPTGHVVRAADAIAKLAINTDCPQ